MGVRDQWRLHGHRASRKLDADFLALRPGNAPRPLDASEVLPGFTPDDMCEAVDGMRAGVTRDERTEAVARIVRRRQSAIVRVREEEAPYPAHPHSVRPESGATTSGEGTRVAEHR